MTVALDLPDLVLARLGEGGANVVRLAEEMLVCGLYREGRLSAVEAMRSLNLTSRLAFEEVVARHHAEREWPVEEVAAELAVIEEHNH
jgi:hypothetical protein